MGEELRLVFLGGVGEIGMNCLAMEGPEGTVVIDCGVMFLSERMYGADVVLPDLQYFRDNRKKIKGVVITHGHEDHIGAVTLAVGGTGVPVFAPPFACGLIKEKALDYPDAGRVLLSSIAPGDEMTLAGLDFEFFRMTHSIPDALGLSVKTRFGRIVHTGDFRVDSAPTLGDPMDIARLKRYGDEGVLLLLSDSTNVEHPGRTNNESHVARSILEHVKAHPGRVLVSMFSSNIERVRQLALIAHKTGRRLGLVGRSLNSYSQIALETGYAPFDPNMLVDPSNIDRLPPERLMLLIAGSQGEPRSALTRASQGEHPDVTVTQGDLVVYSARMIPGNEKDILRVCNNLERRGAHVLHQGNADVHTSGHAYREELADVLRWVRPRVFIPVHGEYRYLKAHARLAEEVVGARTVIADLGDVVTLSDAGVAVTDHIDFEPWYVEEGVVGTAETLRLKERRRLFFNGLVVVECRLVQKKKGMEVHPRITLWGVPDPDGALDRMLAEDVREALASSRGAMDEDSMAEIIQGSIRRRLRRDQERRPTVQVIFSRDSKGGR